MQMIWCKKSSPSHYPSSRFFSMTRNRQDEPYQPKQGENGFSILGHSRITPALGPWAKSRNRRKVALAKSNLNVVLAQMFDAMWVLITQCELLV